MNYTEMDGKQFSEAMKDIRRTDEVLYNKVMARYFREYKNYDDPIVASWNDDSDDVWDAEAFVEEYIEYLKIPEKQEWAEDSHSRYISDDKLEKIMY